MFKKYAWLRHYLRCAAKARCSRSEIDTDKLTFVVPETARGWILDAICRELKSEYPADAALIYHDGESPLPHSYAYFFIHYNQLFAALTRQPQVWRARRFVWYTHNSDESCGAREKEIPFALNRMHKVFTTNSRLNDALVSQGVSAGKLQTLLGAADPQLFTPSRRGGNTVGLSMAYYPRKNPQLLADIVDLMPDVQFVLVGKNWDQWPGFEALQHKANFRYVQATYRDYPTIYSDFDVFLSTSTLEGGPIPLVETMMCNAVPVVSDTGFARDIIQHRENGFLFNVNAAAFQVAPLIRAALQAPWDVAASTRHLSWKRMSQQLHEAVSSV